jgi:hypothetical protein
MYLWILFDSQNNSIISLNNINRLIFVMETRFFKYVNNIYKNLKG